VRAGAQAEFTNSSLYCGISLDWNYKEQYANISMLKYIKKKLRKYQHCVQNCPYPPEPKQYGATAHAPLPTNTTPLLNDKGIKKIQQIIGSNLYYALEVDKTVFMALSLIAVKQTQATEQHWIDASKFWTTRHPTRKQKSNSRHHTW